MALSKKARIYTEFRAQGNTKKQSAIMAGYKNPSVAANRIESNPQYIDYLKIINTVVIGDVPVGAVNTPIADIEERQKFWTKVMRGEVAYNENEEDSPPNNKPKKISISDRLKASEILGKCQGDFVIKIDATLTNISERLDKAFDRANE